MPGSDVAIVGMVGTDCFAIDYYLQSRVQCDYTSGQVLLADGCELVISGCRIVSSAAHGPMKGQHYGMLRMLLD